MAESERDQGYRLHTHPGECDHHHGPGHHHHSHGHHHHHQHGPPDPSFWYSRRLITAIVVVLALAISASFVQVSPGEAVVVTRFGNPVRVITEPGLALKLPLPIERSTTVDLRLRTTSSGLHDVGTKDGLRILVQAYIAWQVPTDPDQVRQFLRAVQNRTDVAAEQLRSLTGSALETTAGGFDLASLINTDPGAVKLADFEGALRARVNEQAMSVYGVAIQQVGLERLTLPAATLAATIDRMRAERQTVSTQRSAEGRRLAAQIRSDADRDARVIVAQAKADVAAIEAKSRTQAAEIYRTAYERDPKLYELLRSLDALEATVGPGTNLILKADRAPFRILSGEAAGGADAARPDLLGSKVPE